MRENAPSNRVCLALLLLFTGAACSHTQTQVTKSEGHLIATVQFPMEGNQSVGGLTEKMSTYVNEAKKKGAELVVFPELATLDVWPKDSKKSESEIIDFIADKITPTLFENIEKMSRDQNIAVLAGSSPRRVGKKIRNTSLLVFPDGKKILHDKIFLTAWERKMDWEPGKTIEVFETPWGKTAILICYDIEFPAVASALARNPPEVILVPSMTESKSGLERVRWTAQARAVELHAFVVVAGTVGTIGKDWQHYGQNLFLAPRDRLFPGPPVEGVTGKPGLVTGRLDLSLLRASREKTDFFPARDQNGSKLEVRIVPLK
jgi:predicted amidohydrolase